MLVADGQLFRIANMARKIRGSGFNHRDWRTLCLFLIFEKKIAGDGPGALDPAVKVNGAVDPGVEAVHGDASGDNDFPGEDFWAGCGTMDLKDWVESVKSQPPDKVRLSEDHLEDVDRLFRNVASSTYTAISVSR